jgi:AcrR family transcriptional regulator
VTKTKTKTKTTKRKQGRPVATEAGVGREGVLAAAIHLLRTLPPAQVSMIAVAREAGVDPALVRYYFKNREALLFEAVRQMVASDDREPRIEPPVDALEEHIRRTFRFTRSARYMQRLMIEELDCASSPDVLEQVRDWNRGPVEVYDAIQANDGGDELTAFDPLFLHLAVIGISDFFVSGAPLIRLLVPPETDMEELGAKYEAFVTRLLLNGLRRREDGGD